MYINYIKLFYFSTAKILDQLSGPTDLSTYLIEHLSSRCPAGVRREGGQGSAGHAALRQLKLPLTENEQDKTAPSSYRPVALTSHMTKLMERLVRAPILEYPHLHW